jgi:hypothetical protein
MEHGFFEVLQGNQPTDGLIIQAIGEEQQLWGTEEAFTLIPNFLITGLLAMALGLATIVWSVGFVQTARGPLVLGLLFIALFLFGGGIAAQVVFAPLVWAAARRIHTPLTGWRKVLPEALRPGLAKLWPHLLVVGTLSFLIGLYIAIFGYVPGVGPDDYDRIFTICWLFIFGGGWGSFLLAYASGFAHDIQARAPARADGPPHDVDDARRRVVRG